MGELKYLKTRNNASWELEIDTVKVGDAEVELSTTSKFLHFELAYPYIYIP